MNKKLIIGIVVVFLAIAFVLGYFLLSNFGNNNQQKLKGDNNEENQINKDSSAISSNGKILIVYYSATGSTKKIAEQISKNLNADLFEIVPEDIYTSDDLDWTDDNSRVSKEHSDESLRDVKLKSTKVNNWENYDTVFIGYPIWWGIAAWPASTFVKNNDFTNKTVIPFCTSASSSLGESGDLLESIAEGGNWMGGHRFSVSTSSFDIKSWTDSLK